MAVSLANAEAQSRLMLNRRVLFVDDEQNVVDAIARQLRKTCEVSTSINPNDALAAIRQGAEYAVVVSDMRMPQMSGVEFLAAVKASKPDIVRIMLTGNQDQMTASAAVNQGEVFRFLNKPCETETLIAVLEQAFRHYQLLTAERELLTLTLQKSIKVLIEALSISKPAIFGSVDRIESQCVEVSLGNDQIEDWEMRIAARLCRLGCVGMPNSLIEKINQGLEASDRELSAYDEHPALGAKLIDEIPRLERVSDAVRYQQKNYDGSGSPADGVKGTAIPIGARVLRLVLAQDALLTRGSSEIHALATLRRSVGFYDPELLERLALQSPSKPSELMRVSPAQLLVGTTIAEDVQSTKGILLVCRGQVVTLAVQRHLMNFYALGSLTEPVLVQGTRLS
jgi:response regulator RpfG family c-di-GMP phosphodiesterase